MDYERRAKGIFRSHWVLFTDEVIGHGPILYPINVNGKKAMICMRIIRTERWLTVCCWNEEGFMNKYKVSSTT